MPMKLSADAINKASRAKQIKARVKNVKENLKDGLGVVVTVLDQSGGQRGGHVAIKKDDTQWEAIENVVLSAVQEDEKTARKLLSEADVELTD